MVVGPRELPARFQAQRPPAQAELAAALTEFAASGRGVGRTAREVLLPRVIRSVHAVRSPQPDNLSSS